MDINVDSKHANPGVGMIGDYIGSNYDEFYEDLNNLCIEHLQNGLSVGELIGALETTKMGMNTHMILNNYFDSSEQEE